MIAMRYHYTPIKMAWKKKKKTNHTHTAKDVEERNLSYIAAENIRRNSLENICPFLYLNGCDG